MDPGRPQQLDKKQLLQQQQLLLQKQLQHQQQHQQLVKQQQQQQQLNLQQHQFKQQQQQLKPQQQLLQSQPNSQPQQQVLQAQPQYLQQQLSPNQQQLLIRNQDFMKQRGMQHSNLNQQQILEHQQNQDQAIIELLTLHDNNKYEDKNQEDHLILQRQQVIQQQQQPSLQRQPLQQSQSQLMQQSQLGQQPQHQQQQPQQQFQSVQQLQNLQQLQTVQQPQLITQPQIVQKTQVERQPQVVRQPPAVQKPNSLQQSQIVQQQNNQYSPVSTQQQSKKQPPPHTQQLLQQQLQQLLLKNKNYPQRIVVLGNQPQQQQLSSQQPQRVITNNSTGQQPQQMQCVVVTNTGQQPQQMQRVVVTGTGQQQQQQQIQRVMMGNNGQPQPQQMQRVVVPTTVTHQQMQRVVVTSTGQQVQQQQLQHVIIPGTSQQQSHQVQNMVTQTSIQQQPQQLQRVVVAPTGQTQVQRVVTSTSSQQQQQITQQHQPVSQRIVIGQLKTSQQTQQMQSPSQNGVVLNQQVIQRPIQQHQRVVITGQQQILKLTNQQQSQQQITLQKQLPNKLLQTTSQQQQQDVVKNQQLQQDVVKNQQLQLDVVKTQHQQQDVVKKLQQQQDLIKKQLQQGQSSQGTVIPPTQEQKNNVSLSNEILAKELHIKQSHQQLQQLHIQPSQKHSQEQINKQLQQQKLKQKKEIDQSKHQLKHPQRSGVIVGQLQQPEKPEPEKLKRQHEIQQQQRQKLQERLLLLQQRQQQQQQKKLKDQQQLQQKHQQQLREQVLLQQHLKQQQQQQLQKKLLLRQQASSENRLSLVVNGNQDQKVHEEKTINIHEESKEPEPLRQMEKATSAERQYQLGIKRKNNENVPVSEKDLLLSSSSDDDDDDDIIRKQRNVLREAERLVQERYDALTVILGSKYQAQYDDILRNWLASRLSREEFDREIRKVMYASWMATTRNVDGDNNSINVSIKTNNTTSKKTGKKDTVDTISKIKEDIGSFINSTVHKSPTSKKVAEINEDIDINIEKKEAKAILAERVPLHNALVTSLITWLPLNCQWLRQRKARAQGVSETGSPLQLYTYADVPQVRGPSDHWYPNVPGSLAHWYWPNNLPCKSSLVENNEHSSPKLSFHEQEKKKVADAVAAAVLIKPPSSKLLPLLMEVAENTEKVRRARKIQYQKRFPMKQNAKVTKRLQWQRLQEQKRLDTMVRLRDGCSKLLPELKMRLRCLANQEGRLIERLHRLQIRMSRRRRQVLAQFKIRETDLRSRIRKFFDRSYLEQPNINSQEHLYPDDSTIEDDETDDDEKNNEKEQQQHFLKQHWKEVHLPEKNHGKKQLKTMIADHQSKRNVRAQRPQSTALTIRLLRDRQRFLATTRLLQVTKQERLQISSNADYVREVQNNNCPCGESEKPCQYRRQIRQLRKRLRARQLAAIKEKIDRELVRKEAEKEKVDAEELKKTAAIETEKKKADTQKKKVVTKSTKKKKAVVAKKIINVEAEEKKSASAANGKTIDNSLVKTNAITNNRTSKKVASLVTTNTKNVETKVRQTLDNLDKVNKGKNNVGINCELLINKSPQQAQFDGYGDTKNRIRPPLPKDKRSVVNVADAAARAAQAALAASKKTQLRKTRAAAAAAAAAAATAASAAAAAITAGTMSSSGKDDNDRRASELMPPPPPPPPPPSLLPTAPSKTVTTPRNPTIGARYLRQQQFLLDRHRQLERIRRDEEERRQRAQDEQQEQECSDREDDETNRKMEDVSSPYLTSCPRMRSKRQKAPVGTIRQEINQGSDNGEQEEFRSVDCNKAKNGEESQHLSDYYFYYGGGDYYSSDEESSESSFIESPFPPLLHDLRIDQLPRPTNRLPAAAVLPPGVRSRLQPIPLSNSKIDAVESSVAYRKPQIERLQENTLLETDYGGHINDQVQKESADRAIEFHMHPNPLSSHTITDRCKITESADKMLAKNMCNKVSKGLQTDLVVRQGQQQMQQGRINDTKMLPEQRKRRQDADKLSGAKKKFEQVQQERPENGKPFIKTNSLTKGSKQDSKQVKITSVTKTNSYINEKPKYPVNQLRQQSSTNKIIRSVPSNRGQESDTRVDIEELRSVQWKAPLTQWNKRPIAYEASVRQRYLIQNKRNDLQHSMKEKVETYKSDKFQISNHRLNDRQQKLRSEIDRQKCERIKMQNMLFEYQELVDTLPLNEQLQHIVQLQQYIRPQGNMIEKTSVNCNPSGEQQQQTVESTNNSCILLDNSTSLQNLHDDGQEHTVLKRISNLLLKIKYQQEEMYQNVVISDDIKSFPEVVSKNLDVYNVEQNDLKNWRDLWPAYEGNPNDEDLMDEEQRLRRTKELIDKYYSGNNDQKSVRSLDQQKRRLGRYGRERLERELPAYQQLRIKQIMQSETSVRANLTEQQLLKRQKLQHIEQHLPERQKSFEQYKRLGRIEQLEQQKHLLGQRQQQLNEQEIQQLQNKHQQNSDVGRSFIQQQRPQYCWMVSKFQVSPTLCYDEQLPLHDQLLRSIMRKKNVQIIKVHPQQQSSKFTMPITATRSDTITPEDESKINTLKQTSRGSQLWWMSIGLERQISPLVTGVDNQEVDPEQPNMALMPISNLPQVTIPQTNTKVASVIDLYPKKHTTFSNKMKLQKWMTPHLINMMTDVEGRWLEQLQTKISQLEQQTDLHWKAMIDGQQQQVKLLLNYDKHLQLEKEKKRLERERRIQQLKRRTPFQALPVHHQQAHTSRVAGHIRQQPSEIPIIVIDDDDDELLNDTTVVGQKRDTRPHPVFIDDDLLKHKIETKVLYEHQHKGISNRWKQFEIIRKAHQKQWEFKLKNLFSYKATNEQFCQELIGRLMKKIKNPKLIKAIEHLNGGPLVYKENQQLQHELQILESQPMHEQPRMLHRQKEPTQKQTVKNRSRQTPIKQKKHKTSKASKKSKKTIKQQRLTHKQALKQHPLNKQGEKKLKKQLPQNFNNTNKNQPKKTYEHQEADNIRQLRSKRTVVVCQPSQKRSKQPNHQNQNKPLVQKKSPIEQHKQVTQRRFQRGQILTKVKTQSCLSSRHMFLLRNRILQVHLNRNKRLRMKNQRLVPKQDITIDTREMQIQQSRNKCIKLVLKTMAYSLYNQRSSLQRQLDRLNENHPDKIDNQLEPSVSKTLIMSVRQPLITSMILSPQQPSTIKQQSLTSTVKLSPQRPLTSMEQSSMSSVIFISQLPMQPYQLTASTSANQPCQQTQQVEEKYQALKQRLNKVHSKLKPLMEMWQLSLQMPGHWLIQQLDDIEQLRQKEVSVQSMLDLKRPSVQQKKQQILENNDVSAVMASTTITQFSFQQLQRIREHLDWRQQRLRDLIDDILILICPEEHPMLSDTTQLSSNCSVLIKLQHYLPMMEQINSTFYSAVLNLQSPLSPDYTQQQFSIYSLLFKLKKPMTEKQQSFMYSTVLKLPQPPMPKQTSYLPMTIATQQPSIAYVSENLIHYPTSSNNKHTHLPNNQLQEKRRLSSGDETNDYCKRLKSSSKKRSKSPFNSISCKRSMTSLTYNTEFGKNNIPIIDLLDSDDDIEILDSDSSTESTNEASFGVQVSEKSPLTIKIIKKKPLPVTQPVITDINSKSEIHDMNYTIKRKENISNITLNKGLELTKNEYFKKDKTMQIEDTGEDFKKLKSTKDEDNKTLISEKNNIKDVMAGTSVVRTIVSRPSQIAVHVNRPKESLAVINKPYVADDSNQILKIAVVECTSSMISNVDNKIINVVPDGRNTIKMMGGVINSKYVNSVDRTISVINKLSEAAVSVIRKTPMALAQNHQPVVGQIPTPMITPTRKSNMKMTKSIDKSQNSNNKTENTKNIKKIKTVTTNNHRQIDTLSKTVRRYRRLNRTLSCETRGPAVVTFRDHGFAQGTIEQIVHGRFVTTLMTMSAAHTIASYIPPSLPRLAFDYASIYQHDSNVSTNINVDNTSNNQNIKTSNTLVTPLSAIMGWLEKTAEISSNIACGNGHLWKGCARVSGPTLMTLSKVTKEAISRKNAIQSRANFSSHLTMEENTLPPRLSRSSRKNPIPVVANSTKRSVSVAVPTSPISNSNGKQQITTNRSTSLTSMATPPSLEIMNKSYTPSTKKAAGLPSSPPSVVLHNRSKSAIGVADASSKQQSNSVIQPTKRSASVAFSSVPLLTSEITTDIADPFLETKIPTSTIVVQPQKRSKSAVKSTNTSTIDALPTLTKPSQREERLRPVKRSASVAGYISPPITTKMSDLSPPTVKPPKRSKSAIVITPVSEAAAASSNNFIQQRPIKKSKASSPPKPTNGCRLEVSTSLSSNKMSIIQTGPTLANTTAPSVSKTFNILKTIPPIDMFPAAPNDAKNYVLTHGVIETGDKAETTHEKTTTITDEDQRTVTVTRTLCPTKPAPMDVTADACSLVTAACEQFIKTMIMERHLKAGRGAGTLQLRRRDAFAAAIAVDDEIRPFPNYCRTPAIGTTIVNPVTSAHVQGENNDVEKGTASELKSVITDSQCDTTSIVMTIDKPDYENERRAVLKQQLIIADSKSNNKLSVLTVKTVIETQTTSSTTTTINKLQCPTTITPDFAAKTRSSRSVIEGTSARTRGAVIFKKTRSSVSTSESTMPSTSEQMTTGDQLPTKQTAAKKWSMNPPPVISPETTVKPLSVVGEEFVDDSKALHTLPPDATSTFNTSTTRGFFVNRGRPPLQPTFNRRQPFGNLVATCTMAAADLTTANNSYFSDDCGQNLNSKFHWLNDDPFSDAWGCYFGDQRMLPPVSRLNNFLNIADERKVPSSENHDEGMTKLLHGIGKADENNDQEKISVANTRQQLILMEIDWQQEQMEQLEKEMKQQVQEYQNRKPDSQEVYLEKFHELQYGSPNPSPEQLILRLPSKGHNRHSLMSW